MIFEQRDGVIGREDPIIERRLGEASTNSQRTRTLVPAWSLLLEQWGCRAIQKLLRFQLLQFFLNSLCGIFAAKLGCAKLAGGKIQRREPYSISDLRHCGQKIVFFRAQ